jgi:hypothetical protein
MDQKPVKRRELTIPLTLLGILYPPTDGRIIHPQTAIRIKEFKKARRSSHLEQSTRARTDNPHMPVSLVLSRVCPCVIFDIHA